MALSSRGFVSAIGLLVGFGALLRWRRDYHTLVLPAEFIGVADESGLIFEVDACVVQRAPAGIASSIAQGLEPMPVAVNGSAPTSSRSTDRSGRT